MKWVMFSDDALLFWGVAFGAEVSEVFGHFHLIWTETEIREHQWETSVYFHYVLWMFSVAVSLQSGLSSQEQECVRHSCSKAPKTFKIHYWTLTHIKVHETHREQLSLFLCSGFLFFMSPFLRLFFQDTSVQEEVEMMVESLLDVLLQTLLSIMSKSQSQEAVRGQRCPQCTAEIAVSN